MLPSQPISFHNEFEETRGRKKLLTDEDIDRLKKLTWSDDFEARQLTWPQLLPAAGIDKQISRATVRRALGTRHWRKCVACLVAHQRI